MPPTSDYTQRHHCREKLLEKFSLTRKRLLLEIRAAADAPPFGRMEALHGDAMRWLWLCWHEGESLEKAQSGLGLPLDRSVPMPLRMQLAIDRWCDAQAFTSQEIAAAVNSFLEDWLASERTEPVDAADTGTGTGDGLGE